MKDILTTKGVLSRAEVVTNLFLNPPRTGANGPDNSEWTLGTQQQLRWRTNITNYDLMLYQQLVCSDNNCANGPVLIKDNLKNDVLSFNWRVSVGSLSLSPTNTFFLVIRDVENEANQFQSSFLNFTGGPETPANTAPPVKASPTTVVVISTVSPSASPTTSSSSNTASNVSSEKPSASPTPPVTVTVPGQIPTTTPTSASTPASTPTPTTSALPPPSNGNLSSQAKLGVIIGIITAVALTICIGCYLGRRRKIRSKKLPVDSFKPQDSSPPVQLSELQVPGWGDQNAIPLPFTPRELHANGKFDSFKGVRELDAWSAPGELGDGNLDNFQGVRELEAWSAPGELGDGRRSRIKSEVYELGPRYT
ncbi:hypothetical protein VTL71DRAFT_6749 [Oculimacula yallundae]|uniref:Uncharacterized protein n=1 Tax=Oculimacula yallundae TaxID=86028 RepID=A0ABR4C0F5_9HELO